MIGTYFYTYTYAIGYRLHFGGSLIIVDVQGWCVSMVHSDISDVCPWLKVLTNAHTQNTQACHP